MFNPFAKSAPALTAAQAIAKAAAGELTLLDCREATEVQASGTAAGAVHIPLALVPLKALDFDEGVNVTLGLPIVRTSPDHGTAFDIAGQDRAHPGALIAAIRMAAAIAQRRAA